MATLADILAGKVSPTTAAAPTPGVALTAVPLALPLRDFQEVALAHALRDTAATGHSYLALDMGLGKTPIGIAVAAAAQAERLQTLVVVPPSLRINWQREFSKFAPWLEVHVVQGTTPYSLPDVDAVIIGSPGLDKWKDALSNVRFGALVVDEAHHYKNPKSIRAKALVTVASSVTTARVLLSGTPTPNGRHQELAGQIEALGALAWSDIGGRGRFWGHYCPQGDRFGNRANANGKELHEALTGSFMIRQLRADVVDLPNKGRSAVSIEATGKAARDYKRAEQDLIAWLHGEGRSTVGAARAEALVRMTTLRRLAGEAKVDGIAAHVADILDNAPGGVFLVAEHSDVMDRLIMKLAKFAPTMVRGGMTDKDKQVNIDAFVSGKSRVMVGQITAAGTGLTLHGDGANHRVVIAQLPWTPADLRQAEDRLHRIGQTHDVEVEVMLAHIDGSWTIDERLWGALEAKNFATGEVIDGEGSFLLSDVQSGILDSYR